jgi:hypothetical protein
VKRIAATAANGDFTMSTPETLDRLAPPLSSDRKEVAAATAQAGIFALNVTLSIVEAPTKSMTAARRLHFVADRCNKLTKQLIEQASDSQEPSPEAVR